MVTTRAGSRAASESLGSPAPKRTTAKSTPKSSPKSAKGTPKSKATPKSTPLKNAVTADDTPISKAVKSALNPARSPRASATGKLGKSARRRAVQKSRLRALRAVAPLELADVDEELREVLSRTLRQLLDKEPAGATICPSRVPRVLAADNEEYKDWEKLLPAMAAVVAEEGRIGKVEFVVNGEVVEKAEGPVRVRRGKNF